MSQSQLFWPHGYNLCLSAFTSFYLHFSESEEGEVCPKEKIMRQSSHGWWCPWSDPCLSLFGHSCPMRRTARISCSVLPSYTWPSPPLSEFNPVVTVSAINLLLKVYLANLSSTSGFSSWPTGALHLLSHWVLSHTMREARDLYFCLLDYGTDSGAEGLCGITEVIWWT